MKPVPAGRGMGWTTEYGAALDARLGALYEQLERIAGGCNAFDLWVNDGYKQGISTDEKATYLTYGEVCGSSIAQVLIEGARATADDVFLDLGAGSGRVVMAASMLGMEAIGVEIVPSLVALSRAAATEAADRPVPAPVSARPHAPEASHHPRASFYHGDFLQLAWWRNCFSDATAPDCADACSALPPGQPQQDQSEAEGDADDTRARALSINADHRGNTEHRGANREEDQQECADELRDEPAGQWCGHECLLEDRQGVIASQRRWPHDLG